MDVEPVSGRLAIGFDQSHLLVVAPAPAAASTNNEPADASTAAAHFPHDESVFALSADWHARPVSGVDVAAHSGGGDADALCLTYSCEDGQLHVRALRSGALLLRHAMRGGGLLAAALHPAGAQIAVGLATGMRVFHILEFERYLLLRATLPLPGASVLRFRHVGSYVEGTQ
jgi:hypothetical protein